MKASHTGRGGWLLAVGLGVAVTWVPGVPARLPAADAGPGRLTVRVDRPGAKIGRMHFGLMTEEINHAYDGGLYAELVRNRIFKDDPRKPVHWSVIASPGAAGSIALDAADPVNATALTTSLRLDITTAGPGQRVGVANEGYWGIPVRPHTQYRASFYARAGGGFRGPLTVALESSDGTSTAASATIPAIGVGWQKYTATLTTGQVTASKQNRLVIAATGRTGTVWLSLVSLFPPTYHGRPNGNRIDLMQKLADLRPAFLRFPGGNYLEGNTIRERFAWEETIHGLERRPGHRCPWGYRSSDGLGLLEFLEWCEDLKMEPVLAVFAGYALRGERVGPGPKLRPFVQEALDEIEYATGDAATTWGKERAKDGHPAPFTIHYVEVGNEDAFDRSGSYDGRFAQFYDAIKAQYPNLQVIATAPVKSRKPDVVDEHFYRSARAMERDTHHYDRYDRKGPKIFVGEWATREGDPTPNLNAALGDAAWMIGMERNADIVVMQCYAPLFVNVSPGAMQWATDLIGYDALGSFGSASYYAQKMFSENRGDTVLPVEVTPQAVPRESAPVPRGGVGVGTWRTQAEYKDIKVTHGDKVLYQADLASGLKGWRRRSGQWEVVDGALRQSSNREGCMITAGDEKWTDYTYSLKARKLGGAEGFLVLVHAQDRGNYVWWNVGGWGNTRTALEFVHDGDKSQGRSTPVTVETGRWYDIRVEVQGNKVRCFLDDKLVSEGTSPPAGPVGPVFAAASRVGGTGEVILKVVNTSPGVQKLAIDLRGVQEVERRATAEVLSGRPGDVNTLAEPQKVAPRHVAIAAAGPRFVHDFPPYSLSVIRLGAK
ncbi:MAG TPA: alpha-L-arabinofuranosidase C-terminal domain-containing protein [Gemmataceae bacterium]|nr:alpha-L-arabinofuranosidase C-terminal domain-containing protein [Gemmataceae bacterium]